MFDAMISLMTTDSAVGSLRFTRTVRYVLTFDPSVVRMVMRAMPWLNVLMRPFSSTVATFVLLLEKVSFLNVASSGV